MKNAKSRRVKNYGQTTHSPPSVSRRTSSKIKMTNHFSASLLIGFFHSFFLPPLFLLRNSVFSEETTRRPHGSCLHPGCQPLHLLHPFLSLCLLLNYKQNKKQVRRVSRIINTLSMSLLLFNRSVFLSLSFVDRPTLASLQLFAAAHTATNEGIRA